ncbi:hypothetical protein GDO86_001656 [Hymenochirus boettgeri]|uniref:Uncharacterized protein n=1 Tax=Hymenochirus boettgeri TaxID=247094 RepID=A0A8T2KJ81_9PIPI|nr:hypothetical protein GDO86_001656 [Hymenochirus boettgeri]
MLPIFLLASMAILGATTLMEIFTNSLIVVVNLLDKVKGKSLKGNCGPKMTLVISLYLGQWGLFGDHSSPLTSFLSHLGCQILYLFSSNIIGCSIPLVLVGISNCLILNSLITNRTVIEKAKREVQSPRTEARERAARTVGCLLLLYMSFYISQIFMFVDFFPPSSLGFCICLMVIYIYSPAQSVILIFGSPKLKKALVNILRLSNKKSNEQMQTPMIHFIKLRIQKTKKTSAT